MRATSIALASSSGSGGASPLRGADGRSFLGRLPEEPLAGAQRRRWGLLPRALPAETLALERGQGMPKRCS
jgi:hypothetical protein